MLHGDAHESWLDDHAPDWADAGAAELAPVVADHAAETTYEEVFEDTTHDHDGRRPEGVGGRPPVDGAGAGGDRGADALDDDARSALAAAREMTRAMLEADDGDDGKA
jgi:hypothetical protein